MEFFHNRAKNETFLNFTLTNFKETIKLSTIYFKADHYPENYCERS